MTKPTVSNSAWEKFTGNPVLGSAELGTCFDVHVHRLENGFRMYFSWRPQRSLAFVESPDGVRWDAPRIILGPNPESGWEDNINRNCVVVRNGIHYMWYTGQARGFSRIGYAVSEDGTAVTLYTKERGSGLLYMEAGYPVNQSELIVVVID